MMDKSVLLNQKIKDLKKKNEELEAKTALFFYKKIKAMLGSSFSAELALKIVDDSWNKSSNEQREAWQEATPSFQNVKPFKTKKAAPKSGSALTKS